MKPLVETTKTASANGLVEISVAVILVLIPPCSISTSNAIPFIFLFLALLFFRRAPGSAAAALFILFRVALVFLAAPAGQFNYLYGVYLFGFFAPLFFWMEWVTPLGRRQHSPHFADGAERERGLILGA